MEFNELLAAFAAKYGVDGLDGADGVAELEVDGIRVEMLEDSQARSLIACAEIGLPPPDANGAFGAMMLKANFLLRATAGATLCQNPETGAYALVRPFPLALRTANRSPQASNRLSTRRRTGARRLRACARPSPRSPRPRKWMTPTTTCFQAGFSMCNLFLFRVYTG